MGTMGGEPIHAACKIGELLQERFRHRLNGQNGHKSHERAHLQRRNGIIGQMEHIIEKTSLGLAIDEAIFDLDLQKEQDQLKAMLQ